MSGRAQKLVIGGEPRVQLLPPQVHERGRIRAAIRLSVFFVLAALVVVVAATGLGIFRAGIAQTELAQTQQAGLDIIMKQGDYQEGAQAAKLVDETQAAILFGSTTAVDWNALLSSVRATLPAGARLDEIVAQTRNPWENPGDPAGGLRLPYAVSLSFTVIGPQSLDATVLSRALPGLSGYVDSYIYESSLTGSEWATKVIVTFDESVYSTLWTEESLEELRAQAVAGMSASQSSEQPTEDADEESADEDGEEE